MIFLVVGDVIPEFVHHSRAGKTGIVDVDTPSDDEEGNKGAEDGKKDEAAKKSPVMARPLPFAEVAFFRRRAMFDVVCHFPGLSSGMRQEMEPSKPACE